MEAWGPPARKAVLTTAAALLLGAGCCQPSLAATLVGHVLAGGQPVPGAFVAATGAHGHGAALSDPRGAFGIPLQAGIYRAAASAPGFAATVRRGVSVAGSSTRNIGLAGSGAALRPVPLYGGGLHVVADGSPGVFYLSGGNVGTVYRTLDWGGTWTQATGVADDPTNGLTEASYPNLLASSGHPGEVAAYVGPDGVLYSTDYGVTWGAVADSPPGVQLDANARLLWGHAGTRSVLLLVQAFPSYAMYVADMTAKYPTFVRMTAPYAPPGHPVAVADGADRPWLAEADSSGTVRLYQLVAHGSAPAPSVTATGFSLGPPQASPSAVGLGGRSAPGKPPSGLLVATPFQVRMSVKAPGAAGYPQPPEANFPGCSPGSAFPALGSDANVAPDTSDTYGAAWAGACWVQYTNGSLSTRGLGGQRAAIDAGYDATSSSPGNDAVVMLDPVQGAGNLNGTWGVSKLARSDAGFPVPLSDRTIAASPGTAPGSEGVAENGVTAATVHQTAFGPQGLAQIASATDVGGAASDDGGASFQRATYENAWSVAWWQGASGSWLLFGQAAYQSHPRLASGFENWTHSTPPVRSANVSGSSVTELGAPAAPLSHPYIDAIAGVPGADTAFIGTKIDGACSCEEGNVRRVSVDPGPSFSNVTPIGDHLITKPGPLAYCGAPGSTASLSDVLLVIAQDSRGGAMYRVTAATGASPAVTKVIDLPGLGSGSGEPALQVDCATGLAVAASGAPGDGVLVSTDGGTSFAKIPLSDPGGSPATSRALALSAGSILVGDAAGYIQRTTDAGHTWTVVNDPSSGINLSVAANESGGIRDLLATPFSASRADGRTHGPRRTGATKLVAGPGEYMGDLNAAAKSTLPTISRFKLSPRRFRVGRRRTALVASHRRRRRGSRLRGTRFLYSASRAGTVIIYIAKASGGHRAGNACVPGRARGRKSRCVAYKFRGALVRTARRGRNRVAFSGKLGRVALRPGKYLAVIVLQLHNGRRSLTRSASFVVQR